MGNIGIKKFLLDLVFPKFCAGCGAEGDHICEKCLKKIRILKYQVCPSCRKINLNGRFCSGMCAEEFCFDQLLVCLEYRRGGLFQKLMVRFKYKFSRELKDFLGKIMADRFSEFQSLLPPLSGKIFVVPVPIHKKKLKIRGFNQTKLLAEILVRGAEKLRLCDCLKRHEYHADQAKLHKTERMKNLCGAVGICEGFGEILKSGVVLLIDDVATTGSTMNECGKVLKEAGAGYVCGLVLARGR
ncbi:MAG: double zinc ribbon domain-containing protein [Candidatus Peregrinibacteria bacterium]